MGGERLNQANGRLKASRVGVKIEQVGNRLYLRATLPPKPNSNKAGPYQQRISLGVHANPNGVKLAEAEARKVGALLDCKEFSWNPYLSSQPEKGKTVADWIVQFEADYFTRRSRNPKSETTWKGDYLKVLRQLPQEAELTPRLLEEAVKATPADTKTRLRFCMVLGAFAKLAEIDFDPRPLKGSYSPKRVTPRDLPTDEAIAYWFNQLSNPRWRWAYGMIATYGIRPHELFHLNVDRLKQGIGIIDVVEGKTGARQVWPCYPEWVEQFSLREVQLPQVSGRNNSELGERCSHYFGDAGVPIKLYNLRHRWAVRTLEFGLDISLAAQQMGHSVAIHSDLYHAWISEDVHQRAFEALLMRPDRPKAP